MEFRFTAGQEAVPDFERLRDFMCDAFEELWLAAGMPNVALDFSTDVAVPKTAEAEDALEPAWQGEPQYRHRGGSAAGN